MLASHQVGHQATCKVGCQPADRQIDTKFFLGGLYGHVCVNNLILLPLKGRIVQPPKTGLKCTSVAALTLQQTVACTILPFKGNSVNNSVNLA